MIPKEVGIAVKRSVITGGMLIEGVYMVLSTLGLVSSSKAPGMGIRHSIKMAYPTILRTNR